MIWDRLDKFLDLAAVKLVLKTILVAMMYFFTYALSYKSERHDTDILQETKFLMLYFIYLGFAHFMLTIRLVYSRDGFYNRLRVARGDISETLAQYGWIFLLSFVWFPINLWNSVLLEDVYQRATLLGGYNRKYVFFGRFSQVMSWFTFMVDAASVYPWFTCLITPEYYVEMAEDEDEPYVIDNARDRRQPRPQVQRRRGGPR